MSRQKDVNAKFKKVYPNLRYMLGMGPKVHRNGKKITNKFKRRSLKSNVIPDAYNVCNTTTIDREFSLNVLTGNLPQDVSGNLYICQCLGSPEAFMMGDTNLVKMEFSKEGVNLKNRFLWNPAAIARIALQDTVHRFDNFGLMFLSPGVGIFSYTEGMYLLPDGRLGITSDVDRPWIVERDSLRAVDPLGKRSEWLPMMSGENGDVMGNLFAGYNNSHVIYTDTVTNELFLANFQGKQSDGSHPCQLMLWDGENDFTSWKVVDEAGQDIHILQSIHELIFTRDYILIADTAFSAGSELFKPWHSAALPNPKTVMYVVDRRDLKTAGEMVVAKKLEIEESCIHLIAEYENPEDQITVYMLHTPATNTAEIIRHYDVNLQGELFPQHMIGYGTLPVLDVSSVGKHVLDMSKNQVASSEYIRDKEYTWGPYMYTYMGRQTRPFMEQDLYVMYKGFSKDILPKRVYEAYKDAPNRRVALEEMFAENGIACNNSIARIRKSDFQSEDRYVFPDKVLLYTISCLESSVEEGAGYLIAGVVQDVPEREETSGHEYWLFDATNLAAGPICTLGHKELNNSTLFHTVYIPSDLEEALDKRQVKYHVPLREDYPREELEKWNPCIMDTFENLIWPYYDARDNQEDKKRPLVEEKLENIRMTRIQQSEGREHLIGEEWVSDAKAHAQKMFAEAKRMFATTGWKVESNKNGLLVESKPVDGVLRSSGVDVTRASGIIHANAQKFFEFITSPEGYAVIDPVSDPDDHSKEPLEVYPWHEGARLEAALATTNIPMIDPSDFVVLNAIDPGERMFASKSILHEGMPGGSKYSGEGKPENGHERALNTFVIQVEEVDENHCKVRCINYADMVGKTPAAINNMINKKGFFPPLYKRMHEAAKL